MDELLHGRFLQTKMHASVPQIMTQIHTKPSPPRPDVDLSDKFSYQHKSGAVDGGHNHDQGGLLLHLHFASDAQYLRQVTSLEQLTGKRSRENHEFVPEPSAIRGVEVEAELARRYKNAKSSEVVESIELCSHSRPRYTCTECTLCKHGAEQKTCKQCAARASRPLCVHGKTKRWCKQCGTGKAFCQHGKHKAQCKPCGGSAICVHNKHKAQCKECGGSGICVHGKNKCFCRACGGSAFCKHDKLKARCKECGGSALCVHGKLKARCKECWGSALCIHGRQKAHCRACGGSALCEHLRNKSMCKECGGRGLCTHEKAKAHCRECGGKAFCEHGKEKRWCKACGGSALCLEHGKNKRTCKECQKSTATPHVDEPNTHDSASFRAGDVQARSHGDAGSLDDDKLLSLIISSSSLTSMQDSFESSSTCLKDGSSSTFAVGSTGTQKSAGQTWAGRLLNLASGQKKLPCGTDCLYFTHGVLKQCLTILKLQKDGTVCLTTPRLAWEGVRTREGQQAWECGGAREDQRTREGVRIRDDQQAREGGGVREGGRAREDQQTRECGRAREDHRAREGGQARDNGRARKAC